MNLRALAKGRECQIRSEVCNGDRETTVLAHIRMNGISGLGFKAPDALGAWSCSACHTWCDSGPASADERLFTLLKGMARTQAILIKEGHLG